MADSLALGIDLGGTQTRIALVDRAGRVLARKAARTDVAGGPEAVIAQITALAAEVSGAAGTGQIRGVGIATPGPLDADSGTAVHIPTLPGWEDFPIRARLESALGLPVIVENDGITAAYGEWRHGAGIGLRHLVYVTVSTGIGGGVVVDDRLMRGYRGMAGHVGHFQMVPNGPRCACRARGCFEALASGTALGKAGQAAARRHPDSLLAALAAGDALDAQHVVQAARSGDPMARELLDQEAEYLGVGFTALMHMFSPEAVIMGGGVSAAFDLLEPGIGAVIRGQAMAAFRTVRVVPAALGTNSGLVGAASLAMAQAAERETDRNGCPVSGGDRH